MNIIKFAGILASLALAGQASASGFEKSIMIGGKSAGLAGIATPWVQGAEALYFNPAGLASDKPGGEVALDISPTWPKFSAPITANDSTSNAKSEVLVPFGLMYSHQLNDKLGLGVGYYVSGGSGAQYSDQEIASRSGQLEAKSQLIVSEASIGAGYKLSEKLKVGLSYRVVMVKGSFAFIAPTSALSTGNTFLENLSGTYYGAFKLGAQYKISEDTLLGFSYRSNSPIRAKGQSRLENHTPAGVTYAPAQDISALTNFPDAYTLGVQQNLGTTWKLMGEYVYTAYSRNRNVQIEGNVATKVNPAIELAWKDQTNVRLGSEYNGLGMPIRFGYVWTSQVADNQYAKPSMVPPGPANTFTLGTGTVLGGGVNLDGALEYTMVDGTGSTGPADAGTMLGDYKVREFAVHLGVNYNF